MRDVTGTGPLSGIRVIDASIAATGPYAAAILADQGADVVKVERPGIGDLARWVGASHNGVSALFLACNRGKRSIAVDVHTGDGRDIVRRLAGDADVFIENFRPGVLDRVGLGYDALAAGNPNLVYASLTGFGSVGPTPGSRRTTRSSRPMPGSPTIRPTPTTANRCSSARPRPTR